MYARDSIIGITIAVVADESGRYAIERLEGLRQKSKQNRSDMSLKKHSIRVKQGDLIKAGDYLGMCGNSGNSSEPHLHFHIMDAPTLKNGTGVKCYFENLIINGKTESRHSPVKGERIQRKE